MGGVGRGNGGICGYVGGVGCGNGGVCGWSRMWAWERWDALVSGCGHG